MVDALKKVRESPRFFGMQSTNSMTIDTIGIYHKNNLVLRQYTHNSSWWSEINAFFFLFRITQVKYLNDPPGYYANHVKLLLDHVSVICTLKRDSFPLQCVLVVMIVVFVRMITGIISRDCFLSCPSRSCFKSRTHSSKYSTFACSTTYENASKKCLSNSNRTNSCHFGIKSTSRTCELCAPLWATSIGVVAIVE